MASYIHGSLAVKEREKNNKKAQARETARVVYRKKSLPTQEKLLYLFTVVVFIFVAGVIIYRYAQIYEVNSRVQQIERDIQKIEQENKSLKIELTELRDPQRLLEKAKELGLVDTAGQVDDFVPEANAASKDGSVAVNR